MESAQEGEIPVGGVRNSIVSILVVMESAQEAAEEAEIKNLKNVSILVVMESAQEGRALCGSYDAASSFNPCCNGKCSGSPRRVGHSLIGIQFQSLL